MKTRSNRKSRPWAKTRKQGGGITSIVTTPIRMWYHSLVESLRYPVTGIFVTPTIFTIMLYISYKLISISDSINDFVTTANNVIDDEEVIDPELIKSLIVGLEEREADLLSIKERYDSVMDWTIYLFGNYQSGIYALNRRTYGHTMTTVDKLTKMLNSTSIKLNSINAGFTVKKYNKNVKNMLTNIARTSDGLKTESTRTIEPMNKMKERAEKLNAKIKSGCPEGKIVNPATLRCIKTKN
jgi:hypothetical protein